MINESLLTANEKENFFMSHEGNRGFSWIPETMEETTHGVNCISLQTKHFSSRRLFLTGEINSELAMNFLSAFKYLAETDEAVDIYINSPGGEVNSGLLIYDLITSAPFTVNLYCTGLAASMAAVILASGKRGHRFILPHSKVMIHEPLMQGGMGGSATSIKKTADSILATKAITNGILAKHTGKTEEEIDEATAFDNYMNANEAIEFGICDSIKNIF